MIVQLNKSIFEQARKDAGCAQDLMGLFSICKRMAHVLVLQQPARQAFDAWVKDFAQCAYGGALEKRLRAQLKQHPPDFRTTAKCRIYVEPLHTSDWSSGKLTLEDANILLSQPLTLLIENRNSDSAFLLKFVGKEHKKELESYLDQGRIRFENGGGLPVMLTTLERLTDDQSLTPRAWLERLRVWVLFDRDCHVNNVGDPPDQPSALSTELKTICSRMKKPWPMPHHQHVRCAIENYLPEDVLRNQWAQKDANKLRLLDALFRNPSRNYLSWKDELKDKSLAKLYPRCDQKTLDTSIFSDPATKEFRDMLYNSILENL